MLGRVFEACRHARALSTTVFFFFVFNFRLYASNLACKNVEEKKSRRSFSKILLRLIGFRCLSKCEIRRLWNESSRLKKKNGSKITAEANVASRVSFGEDAPAKKIAKARNVKRPILRFVIRCHTNKVNYCRRSRCVSFVFIRAEGRENEQFFEICEYRSLQ